MPETPMFYLIFFLQFPAKEIVLHPFSLAKTEKISQVDLIQKRSHLNTDIVIIGEYFQNIL